MSIKRMYDFQERCIKEETEMFTKESEKLNSLVQTSL